MKEQRIEWETNQQRNREIRKNQMKMEEEERKRLALQVKQAIREYNEKSVAKIRKRGDKSQIGSEAGSRSPSKD